MALPTISLRRGVVIDRVQPMGIPPIKEMLVQSKDIQVIKHLGFDHVKLLFTPSAFIKNDLPDDDKLWYLEETINLVVDAGIPCLVCVHPEEAFKRDYLASEERFAALQGFYGALAAWLAQRWAPHQLAFQIMTEPFGNYTDWNDMHPVLWRTVRGQMPKHTLVLSGDDTSSFFALLKLQPVEDDNVYYGFTSYDPFAFTLQSWNQFFGGVEEALNAVGHLPYPASPTIVEACMDDILKTVPPDVQEKAMDYARAYARGDYQRGNQGHFDQAWMEARMQQIDAWRTAAGRHLPVLCNEFGVMDHKMGGKYGGPGVLPQHRYRFVRDFRQVMEQHDIGWSYWSFNETFTIFDPERRTPFGHDDAALLDRELLGALGIGDA